ncbi:DUF2922 domain-containing protein [Alicyclobacillus tolerans]|uniref:DUF2922 domain-containing protein n=1 Tax=Alicyclobacillus tolerans TaxID=90970 RepID=UPI001F172F2B|nr:DUF2922 domain-containing protein [Alicyclobacillus tolerans]MCF8566362.1 DUF2922 domain-containing protein [Alicyclobacillus tolerans]
MASKVSLQMQFLTSQNKKIHITVQNPKQPIDSAAVNSAMDAIVAKNIFSYPQGSIVSKIGAVEVQTDSSTIV